MLIFFFLFFFRHYYATSRLVIFSLMFSLIIFRLRHSIVEYMGY